MGWLILFLALGSILVFIFAMRHARSATAMVTKHVKPYDSSQNDDAFSRLAPLKCYDQEYAHPLESPDFEDLPVISMGNRSMENQEETREQILKAKKYPKVNKCLFRPFTSIRLGSSPLDQAIQQHNHYIAFVYMGSRPSGADYAMMIGYSDEWIDVVTPTRAKVLTYKRFGFNILENRWSYGSSVPGAPYFREVIAQNMHEIVLLMRTQISVREERRAQKKAEAEKIRQEQAECERELSEAIASRKPIIQRSFSGIRFEIAQEEDADIERAEAMNTTEYIKINIREQTCGCRDFCDYGSLFETGDVRRLCFHLYRAIVDHRLYQVKSDAFEDFVFRNLKSGLWGINFFLGANNEQFAIVAYTWTPLLYVFMPKVRGTGYAVTRWRQDKKIWTGTGGAKQFHPIVREKLEELFGTRNVKHSQEGENIL